MPWTWLFMVISIKYYFMHPASCSCWVTWLLVVPCTSYQICRILSGKVSRKQWSSENIQLRDGWSHLGTQKPYSPRPAWQHLDFRTIQLVVHHTISSCCTSRERNLADNNHIRRRMKILHPDICPTKKTVVPGQNSLWRYTERSLSQGSCIKSSFMLIFPSQSGELVQWKFWVGPSDLQ